MGEMKRKERIWMKQETQLTGAKYSIASEMGVRGETGSLSGGKWGRGEEKLSEVAWNVREK